MNFLLIDLPQSNFVSVKYWLHRNGQRVQLFSDQPQPGLGDYDAVLVPGVGAFDFASDYMNNQGVSPLLHDARQAGKLIIGICLGMQLMFAASEEGERTGLQLVNTAVKRLPGGQDKIPNIGWRTVHRVAEVDGPLGRHHEQQFYFMHGFAVPLEQARQGLPKADMLASHSNGEILAAFRQDNLVGFQFHPEKSYRSGDTILQEVISDYAAQ